MSKIELSKEKIIEILESKKPKSLTEIYRHLGGQGKLSGSTAKQMRSLVEGIDNWVANNKASAGSVKSEENPKPTLQKSGKSKGSKKTAKASKKPSKVPRHPKNPFREGSGYGLILDQIADAGSKGIGKEDLLKAYCKATGKDIVHAKYDLAVINSASETSERRHRSCADGFTIIKTVDNYRIRFA